MGVLLFTCLYLHFLSFFSRITALALSPTINFLFARNQHNNVVLNKIFFPFSPLGSTPGINPGVIPGYIPGTPGGPQDQPSSPYAPDKSGSDGGSSSSGSSGSSGGKKGGSSGSSSGSNPGHAGGHDSTPGSTTDIPPTPRTPSASPSSDTKKSFYGLGIVLGSMALVGMLYFFYTGGASSLSVFGLGPSYDPIPSFSHTAVSGAADGDEKKVQTSKYIHTCIYVYRKYSVLYIILLEYI